VDPQAWLADILARFAEHPSHRLEQAGDSGPTLCKAGSMMARTPTVNRQVGGEATWHLPGHHLGTDSFMRLSSLRRSRIFLSVWLAGEVGSN
jgi:hypothetical protein